MIPSAESEAGLKAYEQTLAFAALRRKKLPVIYALFPVLLALMGVAALRKGMLLTAAVCFGAACLFALYSAISWSRLRALDAENRALLDRLRTQYGENLPWLEVERQQTLIRQIEAENLPPPSDPR